MQSQQCLTLHRLVVSSSTRPVQGTAARQPFRAAFKQARSSHLRAKVQRVSITGQRKEVRVEGKPVLLFWYRNQIYAIEARSPAEGAYSEGFANAKFTQDYCIECPSTGTLFSLKDGTIVSWYPTNPVLRVLTPQDTCRNLEVYPVRLTQEAIEVDVSGSSSGGRLTKGGSNTSLENNNVYGLEPKQYVDIDSQTGEASTTGSTTAVAATVVVGGLAALLTGAAIYFFAFQPL
ncbi:hypothetical protein N2152v2_009111 [Parachlorella kessleri]